MPDPKNPVLAFLAANAGLTKIVELEEPPKPYKYQGATVVTHTPSPPPPLPLKVRQVETFTMQGKQVWLFTYTNGTWERIEDSQVAYLKSLELFPAGPPANH